MGVFQNADFRSGHGSGAWMQPEIVVKILLAKSQ